MLNSFIRNNVLLVSKPPGHFKCSGGLLCVLFFYMFALSCRAATPVSLAFLPLPDGVPLIVERSAEKLLHESALANAPITLLKADFNLSAKKPNSDLVMMSLHDLAERVQALQVLELPFFYSGLTDIHQKMDAELGEQLRSIALKNGWVILEWWDEGMQAMSGNRRYDRRINLSGMEFILLRDDSMAQKQYKALNAWSRRVYPQSSQQLLHECVVGSRSATVARVWSERLDRVHLSLSLNKHRYEGHVLLAPLSRWQVLPETMRTQLKKTAQSLRGWQRNEALKHEQAALESLRKSGMDVYELSPEERRDFVQSLPPWRELLPASLSLEEKASLLSLAGD
ncbi:hypothetical protein MNBD_GAMMA11-3461 [hydrothermal vent metagenome]|uniref:TRAP-type C4-dicarboxylate transport system, periplasmic component n=1 Tax=hydrothermal vent metagenome TaxID=652676 RepID=A0A3B0XDQ2_9ZZZZ